MAEDNDALELANTKEEQQVVEQRRFANPSNNNDEWPNKSLINQTGEQAKNEISAVDASLMIEILPQDAMVTEDYRLDRVRIFVDGDGIVVKQPQKG